MSYLDPWMGPAVRAEDRAGGLIEWGPLAGNHLEDVLKLVRESDDPDVVEGILAGLEEENAWHPYPYQQMPAGSWSVWLFLAGRSAGKTDTCAYAMDQHAKGPPCDPRLPGGHRMSIVAPTLGDAQGACFEGPSGLKAHNPALHIGGSLEKIVKWPNGAEARLFGGNSPSDVDRFRAGGNRCFCWVEEAAAIPQLEAVWEQIPFGHRLGDNPRVIMSTTPKPRALLKKLVAFARRWAETDAVPSRWERVVLTRASSKLNPTIDPDVIAGLYDLYGGTRLGRQELEGELLDDYEGALWHRSTADKRGIDDLRIEFSDLPTLMRRTVGVDPSTWGLKIGDRTPDEGEIARGIETGIIVSGIAADRQTYTLADYSKRASPAEWADRAIDAYVKWKATSLVFETNAGGAMGPAIIRAQEKLRTLEHPELEQPHIRFHMTGTRVGVMAADGKRARAEPVAALTQAGRHHMVGVLPLLDDQLCGWDPNLTWSPDRLDAFVWSITALDPWRIARSGITAGARGSVSR